MTRLRSLSPFLVVLTGLMIGGCSLFSGNNEGPPSQVALSLYAGADVNPNPNSATPDKAVPARRASPSGAPAVDQGAAEGPYELNLKGNRAALVEQLKTLLEYFQIDDKAAGIRAPVAHTKSKPPLPSQADPDTETTPRYPLDSPVTPLPVQWTLPKGAWTARESVNPPLPLDGVGRRSRSASKSTPALGQYGDGPSFDSSEEEDPSRPTPSALAVATPITFKILQLKDDSVFLSAGYDQLTKDLKKTLGSTYIDDDDYVLQPGQFKYIEYATISKKARFIAVLANFHNQNGAVWKQVLRLESRGYRYALMVNFRGSEVSIADEGYRAPQPSK